MRVVLRTSQFKRDYKQCLKRGYDTTLLADVIATLLEGRKLPPKHKDHKLTSNYGGARDCHVLNDWVLIYNMTKTHLILMRTGTHADLFGK